MSTSLATMKVLATIVPEESSADTDCAVGGMRSRNLPTREDVELAVGVGEKSGDDEGVDDRLRARRVPRGLARRRR